MECKIMKNNELVQELYNLDIYKASFDKDEDITDNDVTITDSNNAKRKITNIDMSKDDIALLLQAKQTSYIKSIKSMVTFITCIVAIGVIVTVLNVLGIIIR